MRQLRLFGAQELLPRRNVEEEVAYANRASGAGGDLVAAQDLATRHVHSTSSGLFGRPRLKQEARDRRDRRQRLTTEPEGRDLIEIFDVVQLAGGMPLESKQGVIAQHAATVVTNPNQTPA